jgi:mannonate dehydratase
MQMTFRWFGSNDPIPLRKIRQIPGVRGVVSALYDVPVGDVWPRDKLDRLAGDAADCSLALAVVESIPVHEDIKLGRRTADQLIDQYCESVRNMGEAGIPVLCYNFMPIFDWTRTSLSQPLPDGSTTLAYNHSDLARVNLSKGTADLPGWATAYDGPTLAGLLAAYDEIDDDALWENLARFLERVVPAAESVNVRLAIHPDDPPWSIFGLPRIITDAHALDRLTRIVDRPSNGVTFCTGSLGAVPRNDLPAMVRGLGGRGRIHFMHCRNVRRTGDKSFHESEHPSRFGDVDMFEILNALADVGFVGPMRPDHGRMIWGERGRPGYGLHDRALGAMYLQGLWEGIERARALS